MMDPKELSSKAEELFTKMNTTKAVWKELNMPDRLGWYQLAATVLACERLTRLEYGLIRH